ncbi:MAG: 50S ribosomal protein L34 [Patescibacteria group bacterium]|nr:50S ribosomal protein L34 [Patescibacteria group bacterium]
MTKKKRKRKVGFLVRSRKKNGRNILKSRRQKKRKKISS